MGVTGYLGQGDAPSVSDALKTEVDAAEKLVAPVESVAAKPTMATAESVAGMLIHY